MSDTTHASKSVAYEGLQEFQELLDRDLEKIILLRLIRRGPKHTTTVGSIPLAELKPEGEASSRSTRSLFDPDDPEWDEEEDEEDDEDDDDEGPSLRDAWIDRALHWVRDRAATFLLDQDLPKARFQIRARMPGGEPGPFFHAENLLWEEDTEQAGPAIEHVPSAGEAKAALEGRTFDLQRELIDLVYSSAKRSMALQEEALTTHRRATDRSVQSLEDELEFLRTENRRLVEHNDDLHKTLLRVKAREVKAMDIEAREKAEREERKFRREGLNQAFAEVSKLGKAFFLSKGIPEELVPLLQTVAARPDLAAVLQNPNTLAMLQDPELAPQIAQQLQAIGDAYQAERAAAQAGAASEGTQAPAAQEAGATSEAEGTEAPDQPEADGGAEAHASGSESHTPEPPDGSSELPPEPPPVK